jgi:hypothetical protein
MSDAALDDLRLYTIPKTDDPVLLAQRAKVAEWVLELLPEARERLIEEARLEGRLEEARYGLRRVLALRRLALSAEDEARVEACTDLDTVRRWHGQAVFAAGASDVLR